MRTENLFLRWLLVGIALATLVSCGAVVRGSPLSGRPDFRDRVYLSTGGAPRPYRTLGFAQVTGEGRAYAGFVEIGAAALDGTIRGTLAQEAIKLGGDGVIHIEFRDENPPTDYERVQQASNTFNSAFTGRPQIEERRRSVVVTGEIIQFVGQP